MNALGSGVRNFLWKTWRIVRWPILVCVIGYCALFLYVFARLPERTKEAIAAIHAQRLTMADVDGKHLPPEPDPKLVDATAEGIDANKNGIRDDVELAIFKKYPKDIKVRAAELQYAMELGRELIDVFNAATLVAAIQQEGRGYACISKTAPKVTLNDPQSKWTEQGRIVKARVQEVEDLIFNSPERKKIYSDNQKYMTSYSLLDTDCDI